MKILITGSTGFIGTALVKRLAGTEHGMRCLVRKTSNVKHAEEAGAELVTGDLLDKASLLAGMEGCDCVIDLANLYSWWEPDPAVFTKVNINGTRNVMESALEAGVSKVVHVSSVVVYGTPTDLPFTEDSAPGHTFRSEYARTKSAGDALAWELYDRKGLPLVMIYPGGVLGADDPNLTGRFIDNLIHRRYPFTVFNDSVMTYVHVDDVAEAIVRAAEKEGNIGERYLIGNSRLAGREYYRMISEVSGVPLPRLKLPDPAAVLMGAALTKVADITRRPPYMGFSRALAETNRDGVSFDGSKAEIELGLTYTPMRVTVEEAVASFMR